jgi:hypothetical protein
VAPVPPPRPATLLPPLPARLPPVPPVRSVEGPEPPDSVHAAKNTITRGATIEQLDRVMREALARQAPVQTPKIACNSIWIY